MSKVCAFTGHRVMKDLDINLLDRVIENLIKGGCKRFLCGMARGFDLTAAESVLQLKKTYPDIELIACVPCEGQSDDYTSSDKARYLRILENCKEVIVLSDEYYKGCMMVRNRFMVDNCDVVISYLRRKFGGTYYTIKYAESSEKKVISL